MMSHKRRYPKTCPMVIYGPNHNKCVLSDSDLHYNIYEYILLHIHKVISHFIIIIYLYYAYIIINIYNRFKYIICQLCNF